jgi:Protein of unknown function (DUF1189)
LAKKRQYGVFQALYMSFYSKELYQDVIENWKGIGFFYLCLVVILIGIPQALQFQSKTNSFVQVLDKPEVLAKIPSFQITNGAVSVTGDNPYYFPDPKFAMAIVDTTGQTTSLDGTTATVLMTKDTLFYRDQKTKTVKSYPLKSIDFFELNQDVARAWMDIFRTYTGLVAYPFITAWTFLGRLLAILCYGVLVLIYASREKFPMGYGTALRVAAVAQTPLLVARTLVQLAIPTFPFLTLALIIAMAFFLRYILRSSVAAAKTAHAAAKA